MRKIASTTKSKVKEGERREKELASDSVARASISFLPPQVFLLFVPTGVTIPERGADQSTLPFPATNPDAERGV